MNKTIIIAGLLAMTQLDTDAQSFIGRQTPSVKDRSFSPELLWAMGRVGSASASPDGKQVAYNVSYYSVAENKSHTVIYTIDSEGKNEKLLTEAKTSEVSPKYINGGQRIAFLALDAEKNMQVWSMLPDGTDRKQLSFEAEGVDDFMFSPDEKKVLLVKTIKYGQRTSDQHPDLQKATGRVITGLMYRHWDEWVETIPHPFIADFDGTKIAGTKDILANEPYECPMKPFGGMEQLAFSPDSKTVAYTCRKLEGRDYAVSTDADIYIYNIETGQTQNLCKPAGYKRPTVDYTESLKGQAVNDGHFNGYDTNPAFSPDGKYIAWQSMERDGYEADLNRLIIYDLKSGETRQLAADFDSNVDAFVWNADSKSIYFIGVWHGETHLHVADVKTGKSRQLTEGQFDYTSVQLFGKGLLCSRQSMCEATELYFVNSKNGTATQLTHENQYFKDNIDWGTVEPRWTKTVDGKDLLSWIVLPPHFDPNKKYPTLLFCEGGPQSPVSQFWSFRWNMMIMAANGYVVVAPNRRGLPGFGKAWNEEISENYGGHCMDDYFSAIDDAANNLPYVDKDRLGCVGASFGGYSVYWLAGHHEGRFKAFIAHDGIFNLEQQYLETEEMWFANWDMGGAYWNGHPKTFDNSPHRFVDKWDTPILCIQGEKDYRIVSSQAMAAFNAAQLRGIPSQLLIFPDENHWVLKPQNGILWQRTFFNWLNKYVK
ncbi:MAG: S9 family peptidase [Bacteroidaceae bacterium]|nr:S9 family peptidase [Bacteroidaceae bacterium]